MRRYIEETGLPFDILIDESRDVLKAYGVWHRFGLDAWNIARPALFLIDRSGAIRYSFIGGQAGRVPIAARRSSSALDELQNGRIAECR